MTIQRVVLYAVIALSLALGWWYAPTPVEVPQPMSGPGPIITVEPDPQVTSLGGGWYELRSADGKLCWVTVAEA